MKAPVVLLSDRTVCDSRWRGLGPDKFADVYTSALLATMVLVLRSSQPVSYTDAQT